MKFIDLTGQVFGRLTVVSRDYSAVSGHNKYAAWKCECSCGNHAVIKSGNLRRGVTTSCGCFRVEQSSKRRVKGAVNPNITIMRTFIRVYKLEAKKRHFVFELSDKEAKELALSDCVYCGIPPSRLIKLHARTKTPQGTLRVSGIDRRNNSLGYTKENCVSCCTVCNQAKHTMSEAAWFAYLDRLITFRMNLK